MFVEKKVFDPNLEGKAVYLHGSAAGVLFDGFHLVSTVEGENITVIDRLMSECALSVDDINQSDIMFRVLEAPHIEPGNKINRKRGYTSTQRSAEEVREENEFLISILREQLGSIPLHEIIKKMQGQGLKHWNNRNATSYIKSAMRNGYPIVKPEYGHYAYDWSGKNG